MPTIYDLSQPVENEMTFFPGDPQPNVKPFEAIEAPWRVSELHLGSHSGTHIDAASHYVPTGKTIDQYAPDRFVLPGIVVRISGLEDDQPISPESLSAALKNLPKNGALIIRTDWDRFWKTERYLRHPYLTEDCARELVSAGVGLVGVDALNPDSTAQGTSHVHDILLGSDILIVENLTRLSQLEPGTVYQFAFLPLLLPGLDGSPVRAVAWKV